MFEPFRKPDYAPNSFSVLNCYHVKDKVAIDIYPLNYYYKMFPQQGLDTVN